MVKEHISVEPRIIWQDSANAVGQEAARIVADQLACKPDSSIVFPTGKTPLPLYEALRGMTQIDWSSSQLFQLDEYLPPESGKLPEYETFADFMHTQLWEHVDGQKHYIKDYLQAPATYEQMVSRNNGPDLVILGIGSNGHVAFNEPGSQPDSPTRVINLAPETLRSNFAGLSPDKCPHQAMTLGLKAILQAKKVLLLATGVAKHDILAKAFNPSMPPSLDCPASWLKLHPNTLILTDFQVSFQVD